MDDHTYKKIEVVGSSANSSDEAIRNAIAKASQSLKELRWFEVTELRGDIADGKISHFQATVKIGFRLNE
ncbi:MAG: dodecin [Planctomycetaceae bacterium]